MSIILALLIFSGIILFHEFGHYLLARRGGIEVIEFSLGMGPRLYSFERGGTRYSWKLLPFGGSCQMKGEDMADMSEGTFASKSVWTRISVIAAGPVFNFILAYVLAVILTFCAGTDLPDVLAVREDYPAAQAGIEAGDRIVSINGKHMHLYRDVSAYVDDHQTLLASGQSVDVAYERDGEVNHVQLTAQDNGSGRYVIGISGSSSYRTKVGIRSLVYGAYEVQYWIKTVYSSLKMMVTGQVTLNDVSGPVGVVDAIDETYQEASQDGAWYIFLNMLNIAILLSANLGVMNLLPLPALDGGRLLFLFIEAVRRRRVDPELEGRIHFAGLMALMLFMVVVMANDVIKVIQ